MTNTPTPGSRLLTPDRAAVTVGFIGLGNIGRPMAWRLLAAGFELVVHNRSQAVVAEFAAAGAEPASSPRAVAERAELVLTALPFPATVDQVYFGSDGLCQHARPGQILVDHSTVGPTTSRRIAEAVRARGAEFLDAPVSGGPEAAADGSLAIMVGGDRSAFERARSVLELLGSAVRLCGPSGAGSAMKLVNQVLITVHSAVTAEALTFAERAGVDQRLALELIQAGLAASAIFARNGHRIVEGSFEPGARIDLMVKDAGLIRQLCDELDLRLPVFFQARASFERALNRGLGHQDLAGVVNVLRAESPGTQSLPAAPSST